MTDKIISIAIPCYNSAEYMDNCIQSLVDSAEDFDDVEIIIVDDGSTKDNTLEKGQQWEARYPEMIKVVHQENGGHGSAVMTGIEHARGEYYKVVDSDDWVDVPSMREALATLREFSTSDTQLDLMINNYVYEHAEDKTSRVIGYKSALPDRKLITWDDMGYFPPHENLLMHSLIFRTDLLRSETLPIPKHTFYVDNIYAYVPLPRCKTIYYLDVNVYRYYIGRKDQSVNEEVMLSRLDQQFRVTRIMIDAYHIFDDVESKQLQGYMIGYLTMMVAVCSIFSQLSEDPNDKVKYDELNNYFKQYDEKMYRKVSTSILGLGSSLPGGLSVGLYRIARRIFKFN